MEVIMWEGQRNRRGDSEGKPALLSKILGSALAMTRSIDADSRVSNDDIR